MKLPYDIQSSCSAFSGFKKPWFIAGGWAIDLSVGRVTRQHDDIDFCIFRDSISELLDHFKTWKIEVCLPGTSQTVVCQSIADLSRPRHEIHISRGTKTIEVLINDKNGDNVVFRRDKSIDLHIDRFTCLTQDKTPYVNPAWQLLFKAKNTRAKDHQDFNEVINVLSKDDKKWLYDSLIHHQPDSEWLFRLK